MIPRLDMYELHFNTNTKRGMKSFNDFMNNVKKEPMTSQVYMNVQVTDHLGHKTVTLNQFSNRRKELKKMFQIAVLNKLIEDFKIYGYDK